MAKKNEKKNTKKKAVSKLAEMTGIEAGALELAASLSPDQIAKLESQATEASEPSGTQAALDATVLPGTLSAGMVSYLVHDTETGSVFVSEQKIERQYLAAVVADSPLGRKCVRLTSDHKAALRYAKAINLKGASACSNATVYPVMVDNKPHREQITAGQESWVTRNKKREWDNAAQARLEASAE
jgi:hypothetical protein